MGEQGANSIYAHFMRLDRTYQGVVNRLKCVVKEHMLESAPSLVSLRPPPAKRMKRDRDSVGGESSASEDDGSEQESSGEAEDIGSS